MASPTSSNTSRPKKRSKRQHNGTVLDFDNPTSGAASTSSAMNATALGFSGYTPGNSHSAAPSGPPSIAPSFLTAHGNFFVHDSSDTAATSSSSARLHSLMQPSASSESSKRSFTSIEHYLHNLRSLAPSDDTLSLISDSDTISPTQTLSVASLPHPIPPTSRPNLSWQTNQHIQKSLRFKVPLTPDTQPRASKFRTLASPFDKSSTASPSPSQASSRFDTPSVSDLSPLWDSSTIASDYTDDLGTPSQSQSSSLFPRQPFMDPTPVDVARPSLDVICELFHGLTHAEQTRAILRILLNARISPLQLVTELTDISNLDGVEYRSRWYQADAAGIPKLLDSIMDDLAGAEKLRAWVHPRVGDFVNPALEKEMDAACTHLVVKEGLKGITPELIESWSSDTILKPLRILCPTLSPLIIRCAQTDRAKIKNKVKVPDTVSVVILVAHEYLIDLSFFTVP